MKPFSSLNPPDFKNIRLLSFDRDGVAAREGTTVTVKGDFLTMKSSPLSSKIVEKLKKLKKQFHINISSGKSLLYLSRDYQELLWDNFSLQGEMGIFTLLSGRVYQHHQFTKPQLEKSREIFLALKKLQKTNPNLTGFEPKQFLITLHCQKQDPDVENLVKKIDPQKTFNCFWSGEAYDISPQTNTKGSAIKHLCELLNLNPNQVLAVGNDPNDHDLLNSVKIGVTTNPDTVSAPYYTSQKQQLGGQELIDFLLSLV
jgi:HAD superfamily hydrolase (TIGR01484 family)